MESMGRHVAADGADSRFVELCGVVVASARAAVKIEDEGGRLFFADVEGRLAVRKPRA